MGEEACGVAVSCQRTWQWLGACYWCAVDMRSPVSLKHVLEQHQQKDNALHLTNCFSETVFFNPFNPLLSFSFPLLSSPSFMFWFLQWKMPSRNQNSAGFNWTVVKRREHANNANNMTPHRPLAGMCTDTFSQHIYSHSHVIPHVQPFLTFLFRWFWSPRCFTKCTISFPPRVWQTAFPTNSP